MALASEAGAIIISREQKILPGKNLLIVDNPSTAFQQVAELFIERKPFTHFSGIHHTAVIHPTATIHPSATISPYVVIDGGASIGANSFVGAFTYIGRDSKIGNDCMIYPSVTIREECTIGDKVVMQPGTVIGGCGFGFTTDSAGTHTKLAQIGTVTIEDDVEIGSNTTIDRARFQATKIGKGSKIDNLVLIAHGAVIGKHNLIVGQVGIAGSTETGNHVVVAGQSGLAGHIKLCDNVIITGRSGVSKSITKPGTYRGVPAIPLDKYNRMAVYLQNIEKIVQN